MAEALGIFIAPLALIIEGKNYRDKVDIIPRVDTLLTVDTLEYLHRGGRLTAPQALLGKLLGFRPILRLQEGKIVPIGRARSRRQSIAQLLTVMEGEVE